MKPVTPDPVGPGQESVWSYPRPAIAEPTAVHIQIVFGGQIIADTRHAIRTLETSHPPTYYLPPDSIEASVLEDSGGTSFCEWKGMARYFDVIACAERRERAAWSYPDPTASFEILRDHVAFYPGAMDACYVDGERVTPQPGDFYGGWITSSVAGPFKGVPGSRFW
ncbi:DUF427 domain-containing protein [Croceicoccus hydrothermalis]|uniref:DUF427 domain-containing protein n=1 Tax=Croceicoccus hydrothermalis TaxID=2867964 RepID=UPI001EFBA011|nr:DUF427 domain-containing protein [Croceicoccus hydrothermalis]